MSRRKTWRGSIIPKAELQDRQYNKCFLRMMQFEAARARDFFSRAAAALPPEDRRAMAPAEIMASIYRGLLRQMELDKFRVFEKEYQLSKLEKAGRIAKQLVKSFLNLAAADIRLSCRLRNLTKDKPMKKKSLKILSAITGCLFVLGTTLYAQGTDSRIGSIRMNGLNMGRFKLRRSQSRG